MGVKHAMIISMGAMLVLCGLFQFAAHMPGMKNAECSPAMPVAYRGEQNYRSALLALFAMFVFMFFLRAWPRRQKRAVRLREGTALSFLPSRVHFLFKITDSLLRSLRRGILHPRLYESYFS